MRIIDWYGGKAIITQDQQSRPVRIEFDYGIEDGQVWVYVYRGTWHREGLGPTWAPVRRIPMGNYRATAIQVNRSSE